MGIDEIKEWLKEKRDTGSLKIAAIVIAIVTVILVGLYTGWKFGLLPSTATAIMFIILSLLFALLLLFLILFTKPIPKNLGDDDTEFVRLERYWMTVAYSFMILALGIAVYPFTMDLRLDADDAGYIKQLHRTLDSPIGIFRGCTIDRESVDQPLHCSGNESDPFGSAIERRLSWVLQIGGYVTPFPTDSSGDKELQGSIVALSQNLDQAAAERKRRSNSLDDLRLKLKKATGDDIAKVRGEEEVANAEKELAEQDTLVNKVSLALYWLDGENRSVQGNGGFAVSGGLIIPFYIIILSLIGGAISLTRRIPEYQKQVAPGYVGTENAPALTLPMLREYLVFQIIQFISAPFIAGVAYYLLQPSSTPATVGLAFAAGFASETVLLWVRGVVNKLSPEAKTRAFTGSGSLAGTIEGLKDKSAQEVEKEYTIGIIGHDDLVPVIFDDGLFTIDSIPEGARALEVVYNQASSGKAQSWCQRVSIQAGKTVPVWVKLNP